MRVIATVGLPGSGKGEAAAVAEELGVPVVTMGDVIREACRERGLDPAEHHGRVAQALREENGPAAIAERSVPQIEDRLDRDGTGSDGASDGAADGDGGHDAVLVDGVRSDVELDVFEERFGEDFALVSIEAPFEVRKDRLTERGRDNLDGESLEERDERERGFGLGAAMDRADVTVDNTGSLAAFRERIETLLTEGVAAYREEFAEA